MTFEPGHNRPGPGRKSLVEDPDFRKQFCDLVRTGLPRRHARAKMGVWPDTYKEWENKARENIEPFASFFLELAEAESDLLHGILKDWKAQVPEDWRAGEAFLKRHPAFREDMGDRSALEVTGAGGAPLQVVLTQEEQDAI